MTPNSIFLETFGSSPTLRILDFLIIHEDFDYSMTDIANHSNVGYATLKLLWPSLLSSRIIVPIRRVGKAKMFQLNNNNETVKHLKKLYWSVTQKRIHASSSKR
jgi:hypothetical protein